MIDPYDHISYFQTSLNPYDATGAAKYRMFSTTFRGTTRTWFDSFLDQSIHSFKQLYRVFIEKFSAHKRQTQNMASLWLVVQRESESLRNYIKRYTSAWTDMKDMNNNFVVHAFSIGVSNEHIQYDLIHGDISIIHEIVARAQKFIKANKMRDHYSAKGRNLELRRQKLNHPNRPQQRKRPVSRPEAPK